MRNHTTPRGFRISELSVGKSIDQLLAYKGWTCIPTPAEALMPSGGRIYPRGHADRVYVRIMLPPSGQVQFFFAELKRPRGKTSEQRRAEQAAFQLEMQARGFVAYRCPDGEADPVEHFAEFYKATFGEELL